MKGGGHIFKKLSYILDNLLNCKGKKNSLFIMTVSKILRMFFENMFWNEIKTYNINLIGIDGLTYIVNIGTMTKQ